MILGIDEVGRGAWAGPMAVGAVVLPDDVNIDGLADSKALTKKRRMLLKREICASAACVGIGWVSAKTIDAIGLSSALKLAARRAVAQINTDNVTEIIIDGTIRLIDDPRASTLAKADALVESVSAASIIAKVARDTYMARLAQVFPDYLFEKHVGYGTTAHMTALERFGVSPVHRASFSPIAQMLVL